MEPVRSQPPDDAQRSALLFVQVLSRMMDLEVELPAELMDEPYLCAWFMRELKRRNRYRLLLKRSVFILSYS